MKDKLLGLFVVGLILINVSLFVETKRIFIIQEDNDESIASMEKVGGITADFGWYNSTLPNPLFTLEAMTNNGSRENYLFKSSLLRGD